MAPLFKEQLYPTVMALCADAFIHQQTIVSHNHSDVKML